MWGHYRTVANLRSRIHGCITDPALNAAHLGHLGSCHYNLGEYRQALDLHTQVRKALDHVIDTAPPTYDLARPGEPTTDLDEFNERVLQALATVAA